MFDGYTGGGSREVVGGLMNIGDVGHLDAAGRLFVDGREDDMILSGGENVYPQEVEDLLVGHPQLADAAVIGVEDPDFGQRLRAFAVARDDGSRSTEEQLDRLPARAARPLQAPARGRLPRRDPAQPDGQGAQARSAGAAGLEGFRLRSAQAQTCGRRH